MVVLCLRIVCGLPCCWCDCVLIEDALCFQEREANPDSTKPACMQCALSSKTRASGVFTQGKGSGVFTQGEASGVFT